MLGVALLVGWHRAGKAGWAEMLGVPGCGVEGGMGGRGHPGG